MAILLTSAIGPRCYSRELEAAPPQTPKFPLLWAQDVPTEDLEAYRQMGFNCLFLKARGDFEEQDWDDLDETVAAAQKNGLWLVIELETSLASTFREPKANPNDRQYVESLREWTSQTVQRYRSLPNLLGWSAESGLEGLLAYSQDDFNAFLKGLNRAGFPSLGSESGAVETVTPLVGRPAMLEGLYHSTATRATMQAQADFILEADSSHFLFSGQQRSFRSIAAVPGAYDFVISATGQFGSAPTASQSFAPAALGLELARGGNHGGETLALLDLSPQMAPPALESGVKEAFLHGARGVGISSWAALKNSSSFQEAFRSAIKEIGEAGMEDFRPEARVAVVYSPLAGGLGEDGGTGEGNNSSPGVDVRAPGSASKSDWTEPGDFLLALAAGTRYGAVDLVTEDNLAGRSLEEYKVILAPSILYVSPATADWLEEFVARGGLLVADLGFSAFQSRSFRRLPAVFNRSVFGITALRVARVGSANLIFTGSEAFAPSIGAGEATGQQGEPAFIGPIGEASISPGTRTWALVGPLPRSFGRLTKSGLLVHPWGNGFGVFATLNLWGHWPRLAGSDPLFGKFHSALMGPASWAEALEQPFLPQDWRVIASATDLGVLNLSQERRSLRIGLAPGITTLFGPGVVNLLGPEGTPRALDLTLDGNALFRAVRTPITASSDGPVSLSIEELTTKRIVLRADPLGPATEVALSLTFPDGNYRILPRSRHTLSVEHGGERSTWLLRADANQTVTFSDRIRGGTITLQPADSAAAAKQ